MSQSRPLLVGISGGSGPILGVRLLEVLRELGGIETHLIASPSAIRTLALETPEWPWERARPLASHEHDHRDIAAAPASGSFRTMGMVVIPASMHTAAAIAYCQADNLLVRAADVTLKERRPLIVVPRESPWHLGHLRALTQLAEIGGTIVPPVLGFYHQPRTMTDLIDLVIGKVLDLLSIDHSLTKRWSGPPASDFQG